MKTVDLTSISREAKRNLTKYDEILNTDEFGATEKFNDIWNETQQELCDMYNLPAFHLWEDGFSKGDASDEDIVESVQNINDIEDKKENYPEWEPCPVVSCEINDESDELDTDVFFFLDNKFSELIESKIEKLISEYESKYKDEYEDMRKYMDERSLEEMNR